MLIVLIEVLILATLLPGFTICDSSNEWYKSGNFYEIWPRSFKDSDGDGIGDLNGITSKLEYLKEIGIDGVWIAPMFKSPLVDAGYDISDYYQVHPDYGTMADFEKLVAKCDSLGIKLLLDFVPNHTSDQHEWFIKSVNKEPGYGDFYIWHPGKVNNETGERSPPTNWISFYRKSSWQWNDKRQEYYYHQFANQQPDLNHRHPKVVENMRNVLLHWLGKGVSGFRIDAVETLFEIPPDAKGNLPDEPLSGECNDLDGFCYLKHIYTRDFDEVYDTLYQWQELLEQYRKDNGGVERVFMVQGSDAIDSFIRYYGDGKRNGSRIPFNFHLMSKVNKTTKAAEYKTLIDEFLSKVPVGYEANWVLGNHDRNRLASRLGEKRIDLYNILLKTLPGIPITYYGEEIGMTDVIISWEDTTDTPACKKNETTYHTVSRDVVKTPFQWDGSQNSGFTTNKKPWLPISANYKCVNVNDQRDQAKSHLNVYKRLTKLRKEASLINASFESAIFGDIYTYKRQSGSFKPIIVAMNFGKSWQTIDLTSKYNLSKKLMVVVASIESQYTEGQIINGTHLTIPNDVGIVLTTI